jgi:hypothetical protein
VYSAMEWVAILANLASGETSQRVLCPSRSGFMGSGVGSSCFSYVSFEGWADGRLGLHSSRHGDVPSSWAPTTPGMALQCLGWQYNGGDGRTGPELAEETRSTSPTSRRRPVWARSRCPYPFRGFRRPPSRGAACRSYGSGRHSVTELTLALLHSPVQCQGWPHKEG